MEESFELISSMSPKITTRKKSVKHAPSILALKKHFRRSSVYDNATRTVNNDDLIIIDGSTDSSNGSSANRLKNTPEMRPIVISDTDVSEDESSNEVETPKNNIVRVKEEVQKNDCSLSDSKVDHIQKWLEEVNKSEEKDCTFFSEVSTIFGDTPRFNPEGVDCAVNSTFLDLKSKPLDELFKKNSNLFRKDNSLKSENSNLFKKNNSLKSEEGPNSLSNEPLKKIVESSVELNLSNSNLGLNESNKNLVKSFTDLVIEDSFDREINLSLNAKLGQKCEEKNDEESFKNENDNNDLDAETLLDSLYGDEWRNKREHVLPKSEPRKKLPLSTAIHITNTERKPKLSKLRKNAVNSKPDSLLKTLHVAKMKVTLQSPWVDRFRDLCDPDSDISTEPQPITAKQLDFNDDDDDSCEEIIKTRRTERFSKYFANIKKDENTPEKDDFSGFSESLEERIRKKINNVKNPTKTLPKPKKSKAILKENNDVNTNTHANEKKKSQKTAKTDRKSTNSGSSSEISVSSDEEWDLEVTRMIESKKKTKKPADESYSFLESLSASAPITKCDVTARIFRTAYKQYRTELASKLFKLFNENVFDSALPSDTLLEWNDRMRGTAGYCYCKKITHRTGAIERKARIVLSAKVLDSPDRLRDTLIHEMCHAAAWVINCISDGHGTYWKSWAFKAMQTFPELPPIKRCHDYVINTKYTYKCTGCGYSIGRHTKSLDIERKRCGYCYGKFEVLINKTSKKGETRSVPVTPRKQANGFALFVKENYSVYKSPQRNHGEVMKILGQKFSEMKVKAT